ncbi:MAG: hypothetical protein EHM20_14110 [Alphaproteobacteria bacterium]|nr:MAG: hypothetical protein EHM20_14110 [Alphaproteobacteria bacterium]
MKLRFKYSLLVTLAACLSLLGACGKKENKVNSSTVGIGISGNNPLFSGAAGQTIAAQYNSIRSSVACLPGRTRLANDVSFYVTGSFSGTKILGNWTPGFMTSGTVSAMYVGVGAYRDLMFLTKVTNGSQVVGYNVTLSYCDVANQYPNYPAVVSNERALVNFQTIEGRDNWGNLTVPNGIVINTATSCGYGLIASAATLIISQRNSNPLSSTDFPVYTSFTKPTCNN